VAESGGNQQNSDKTMNFNINIINDIGKIRVHNPTNHVRVSNIFINFQDLSFQIKPSLIKPGTLNYLS
jgi:hypothetical protein